MGQGQSAGSGQTAEDDAPTKTDYYELLGVERQATDDEIKRAYRRKALELHPDRNYGNVEQATKLFSEIQSAYEVLSDPQERAWYDSHRDVLLRGGEPAAEGEDYSYNIRMTTSDEVLKLMMKFNGRLNFNNFPDGFYGGLQDFFQQLAKEEAIAAQWEDGPELEYPVFGHKEDGFEDVVKPFYAAWNGFATRKSYSWKDHYRLSEAPDRRVRRLMEKENKRIRDDAIHEFNDAVRSLVAFVRKRDPRYQENLQSEAERQKTLRDAAAAQAARSRAANKAQLDQQVVPEWAKSEAQEDNPFSDEDDQSEEEQIECVVCNKTFKSEKQYQAHEKSKKHLKLLKQLKREMRYDESLIEVNDTPDGTKSLEAEDEEDLESVENDVDNAAVDEDSASRRDHGAEAAAVDEPHSPADSDISESTEENDDYASREEIASRLGNGLSLDSKAENVSKPNSPLVLSDEVSDSPSSIAPPKVGKAKQKRAKKAAAQQQSTNVTTSPDVFACTICGSQFPSKTKMFAHVRDEGHAALKSTSVAQPGTAKRSKKGKKG